MLCFLSYFVFQAMPHPSAEHLEHYYKETAYDSIRYQQHIFNIRMIPFHICITSCIYSVFFPLDFLNLLVLYNYSKVPIMLESVECTISSGLSYTVYVICYVFSYICNNNILLHGFLQVCILIPIRSQTLRRTRKATVLNQSANQLAIIDLL